MLSELVRSKLSDPVPCFGHCSERASHRFIREDPLLIAAFACPAGYVSRLVVYSNKPEQSYLKEFVREGGGGLIDVQDADIRVATRHPWDLGAEGASNLLTETYWTQSYRRTKSDDPKRTALFVCSRCSRLFTGPVNSTGSLCGECSSA